MRNQFQNKITELEDAYIRESQLLNNDKIARETSLKNKQNEINEIKNEFEQREKNLDMKELQLKNKEIELKKKEGDLLTKFKNLNDFVDCCKV